MFDKPAILLVAMLNCDTIKLETHINICLLVLIVVAISYSNEMPTTSSIRRILPEILLEVLTTIVFPYAKCIR